MEKCLYWKSGQALEQAAQGGDGVPFPGGVQKPCRRGTSGYGLVDMVMLGCQLDLMILEVFSNLWFYDSTHWFVADFFHLDFQMLTWHQNLVTVY